MNHSYLFIRQNRNLVKKQKRLFNNKKRLEKEELKMRVKNESFSRRIFKKDWRIK
jgi:hypothetical protein